MKTIRISSYASIAMILLSILSMQTAASFAKQLFPVVGPEGTTAIRLFYSSLILCLFWRPWRKQTSANDRKKIIGYGLALGFMNLTFYMAIERIPLGITIAIEFLGPLTVALLSSRRAIDYLWAFLAMLGILLILPLGSASGALDPFGVVLAALAGVGWALYIVLGKHAGTQLEGSLVTSLGLLTAALAVFPVGVWRAGGKLFDLSLVPAGFALGLVSSSIPYSLEMIALKKLPKQTFGILMSLGPVVGCLLGWIILGEALSATQWIAVLCIVGASIGASLR